MLLVLTMIKLSLSALVFYIEITVILNRKISVRVGGLLSFLLEYLGLSEERIL